MTHFSPIRPCILTQVHILHSFSKCHSLMTKYLNIQAYKTVLIENTTYIYVYTYTYKIQTVLLYLIYAFRADHLALDNQLIFSSLVRAGFTLLPIFLCACFRSHVIFLIQSDISIGVNPCLAHILVVMLLRYYRCLI